MKAFSIGEDERVLALTRKHWATFLRDAGGVLGIGVGLFIMLGLMNIPNFTASSDARFITLLAFAEVLWVLILWGALMVVWTNYYLNLWIVTNRRIINVEQTRLFSRSIASWQFEDIRSVSTETKNPLQGFFNYGLVLFKTKDSSRSVRMEGIPHPDLVANSILHQLEKYRQLEETAKQQEELLHTVGHEVKAHLTKNQAVLASIAEGDLGDVPEKVKLIATTALQETRRGVSMVMDLLSSSNFKTGAVKLTLKLLDLSATVEAVYSELVERARQKGLTMSFSKKTDSFLVHGDAEKLKSHVVRNLLENAINYTPRGTIDISLSRIENAVLLAISDTGVGIAPDDMHKLFTQGGRGKNAASVNPASTGFGLFIAKQLVEAHGGVIWAKSEGVGKGSTFYVCFPAASDSTETANTV